MRALVTGSGGFVGGALLRSVPDASVIHMGAAEWRAQAERADFRDRVVFHLAARVHRTRGDSAGWMSDNVEKTLALAQAAARGGARRLVFLSTLKVHGDETRAHAFRPENRFDPPDDYARSKALAEERLAAMARASSLEVVTLRAPLLFGRGAKANLAALLRLADSPLPLPFAAIANRRSWLHVDDLCSALLACGTREGIGSRAFIAAHPQPFSTCALVSGLRARLARPRRLFAMPRSLLEAAAMAAGKRERMLRLTRSLEGDASETLAALAWQPRVSFEAALDDLVAGYRA